MPFTRNKEGTSGWYPSSDRDRQYDGAPAYHTAMTGAPLDGQTLATYKDSTRS